MENNSSDLKKKLMESLPDEMDDKLFEQLQNDINRTVKAYEGESSGDAVPEAAAGEQMAVEDDDDSAFDYDRIMEEMSDVEMPPELEERLRKINEQYLASCEAKAAAEEKNRSRARRLKHLRSAAAVIAAFAVISVGFIWKAPQAEAFRLKLYDTVFSPTDEDVGVEFVDTVYNNMPVIEDEALKAKANEIIERDGFILYPSVLPDGYELSEIENDTRNRIIFTNSKNIEIEIMYYNNIDVRFYNDSDKSDNVEMLVNGQNAVFRDSSDKKELYWSSDQYDIRLFVFDMDMSTNSVVEIADNIKKFNVIS